MCEVVFDHAATHGHALAPAPVSKKPVLLEGDTAVVLVHPALSPVGLAAVERLVGRAAAGQLTPLLYTLGPLSADAAAFAERARITVLTISSDGRVDGGDGLVEVPGDHLQDVPLCPRADQDGSWAEIYGDSWRSEAVSDQPIAVRCPDSGFIADLQFGAKHPCCSCGAEFKRPVSWDVLDDAVLVAVFCEVSRRLNALGDAPELIELQRAKAADPWDVHFADKHKTLCGMKISHHVKTGHVACRGCVNVADRLNAPYRDHNNAQLWLGQDEHLLAAGTVLPKGGIPRDVAERFARSDVVEPDEDELEVVDYSEEDDEIDKAVDELPWSSRPSVRSSGVASGGATSQSDSSSAGGDQIPELNARERTAARAPPPSTATVPRRLRRLRGTSPDLPAACSGAASYGRARSWRRRAGGRRARCGRTASGTRGASARGRLRR